MYWNTPKEGTPPPCKDLRWGRPGKQDFSGPQFWSHFCLDPLHPHPNPTPRITLLVHRIFVVHTAIETQFLRNASRLATPPNCCLKTSPSPKTLQWGNDGNFSPGANQVAQRGGGGFIRGH